MVHARRLVEHPVDRVTFVFGAEEGDGVGIGARMQNGKANGLDRGFLNGGFKKQDEK